MKAPLKQRYVVNAAALATDAEGNTVAFEAPFDGEITSVGFIPNAAITGANTNNRKVAIVNKGQSGAGTVEMAGLTFASGVNAAAYDKKALTLSVVDGAVEFNSGDVVTIESTAPGTGIADPGGQYVITVQREA